MKVLGLETSCDETGVAVYDGRRGLLADAVYSQVEIHAAYGGVVPELASRDHVRKLVPLVEQISVDNLSIEEMSDDHYLEKSSCHVHYDFDLFNFEADNQKVG